MARNGITVYLPRDIEALVARIAREQHRSTSSVIAEATRIGLNRKPPSAEDIQARVNGRLEARLDKAIRDGMLIKEALLLFVRVWLEHNPPVEEHLEEAAAASAEARFERFLDYVARSIDGGRSLALFSSMATDEGALAHEDGP
ncbi:MAG: hypothetical protein JNJ73_11075 [Hyphomonadaceae bacterium]|nr:hypothetical protein [Hyphomonadaceae bacterium]